MPILPPTLRRRTLPLVGALVPLIVLVVILLTSSAHVKGSLGRWTCRMSWMSPSYIQLRGAEEPSDWAGRWRLFLYREQGWDGDPTVRVARHLPSATGRTTDSLILLYSRSQPNGLPVLYIPGNAGSYQQARSIASSAAHQFWAQPYVPEPSFAERGIRPLDIFTGAALYRDPMSLTTFSDSALDLSNTQSTSTRRCQPFMGRRSWLSRTTSPRAFRIS